MKNNTFIIGKRVFLRTVSFKDVRGPYVSWFNDYEVCRYNSHHIFPYSYKQAIEYVKEVSGSKTHLVLAIVTRKKKIHIGNISLQNIDFLNRCAEIAIIIGDKRYWKKGYAKEASNLVIIHAFREMNLNRVYCGTSHENISMQKLSLSLGMKQEGTRRKAMFKSGKFVDVIEYGLLKEEYIGAVK